MIRRSVVLGAVLALFATIGLAGPGQAATPRPLPVPYSFLPSAVLAGLNLDADPPGANDFACKPTAAHPRPVVLVHGLSGNKNTNWQTMSPLLKNNGYCVFALTYGIPAGAPLPLTQFGGFTLIEESAAELGAFIDEVLAATGATQVDIVGHSEGTVVPNAYAKFLGGAAKINQYVSIAPLWNGTNPLGLANLAVLGTPFGLTPLLFGALELYFASGPQLLTGGDFFTRLRADGGPAVPGITYTNIVTRYDELVIPYTSGFSPGMTNIDLQKVCPWDFSEHFQIVASPNTGRLMLNALDPASAQPVRCRLVLPFVGTL
ncbi:triacylglycerol lipase [Aeromicrobium marinum DSM 15272]|uniref:Triacylglycerol lipase n=1 Tax=Aeromicrobium marinum DSM 15272 TaxID=585531 RepID=E2S8C7_9ACTN|nr:alpha/beta fold hydrolase [Aeromicrobium marinum]EFQ84432.1 triacylglycerol lipase [Aeromicrobium marinum DSM 15272]